MSQGIFDRGWHTPPAAINGDIGSSRARRAPPGTALMQEASHRLGFWPWEEASSGSSIGLRNRRIRAHEIAVEGTSRLAATGPAN